MTLRRPTAGVAMAGSMRISKMFKVLGVSIFLGTIFMGSLSAQAQTIEFTLASSSGDETTSPANLEVSLSEASASDVTVNYAVTGGTATAGNDYTAVSGTLTWIAGDTTNKTISVPIVPDIIDEDDETIQVTISDPVNATLGAITTHTYTILDNDDPPTVSFSAAPYTHAESGTQTVTVALSAESGKAVSIDYATSNGTATAGSDYTAASGTLTWTAGDTADKTFTVPILADTVDEVDETVNLTLSAPVNCTISGTNPTTLTITDDDGAPTVSFSGAPYTHAESGTQTVTVALSAESGSTVTVNYATSNGTGTAGSDYTAASGTLTWTAGDTADKTFTVPILADTVDEANETVNLTLSTPVNCTISGTNPTTLTITDDDVQGFVSVDQINIEEGSTAALQVSLAVQPSGNVTVAVAWNSGDTDITVQAGASLTFTTANWDTYQTVTLAAAEDTDIENGSAVIRISSSGVTNKDVTATEQDNDTLQIVTSANQVSVGEGSTANLEVKLSAKPSGNVTVAVTRSSGDTDITVQSGTSLVFNASNWDTYQTVTLAAAEDADAANGQAVIRLNANNVPDKDITATEQDNDTLQFVTNVSTVNVPEGGSATFQVRLSAQPSATTNAAVSRASGDFNITVQSGASLAFTTANWNVYQTVTLAAAEDADSTNGTATIRISATGLPNKDVTATEQDDDSDNGTIALVLTPSLSTSGMFFEAAVQISGNTAPVTAFGLDFVYAAGWFNYEGEETGTLTSNWTITVDSSTAGRLKISGVGGTAIPASSSGSLFIITFQVRCLGNTVPTISTLRLENYTDDLLDEFLPLPCASNFTFYPCARLGDVNNDDYITPGDAQSAFEIYLGKLTPTFCQQMTSDGNCSLGTTPGDAQDIFEHYLGKKTLPVCCTQMASSSSKSAVLGSLFTLEEPSRSLPERGQRPTESSKLAEERDTRKGESRTRRALYALDTVGRPGEVVDIPVVVSSPMGLRSFAFDLLYPLDMLEFIGARRSILTQGFDYVLGAEEYPGLIHIEAESQQSIPDKELGSLVLLSFRVREGEDFDLPIQVLRPIRDLSEAEAGEGIFVRSGSLGTEPRWVSLGNPVSAGDSIYRIPVLLNDLFGLKAFGFEARYAPESAAFLGIEWPGSDAGLVDLQALEVEAGRVRVGGFRLCEDLRREPGILVELVFRRKAAGAEISLEAFVDDLEKATVTRGNLRLE